MLHFGIVPTNFLNLSMRFFLISPHYSIPGKIQKGYFYDYLVLPLPHKCLLVYELMYFNIQPFIIFIG